MARSTEVITGRGVAQPPNFNLRTSHRNQENSGQSEIYSSYQTNSQQDIYHTLREKLQSNQEIQKYILSLKKQLQRQRLQSGDYNRANTVGHSQAISSGR